MIRDDELTKVKVLIKAFLLYAILEDILQEK